MARNYRVLLPNGLTFLSLLSGTCAILVTAATPTAADAPRYLWVAGLLILASYLIDWCDGALARNLHASTAFGLQRAGAHGCVAGAAVLLYGLVGLDECLCGDSLSPCGRPPYQARRVVRGHSRTGDGWCKGEPGRLGQRLVESPMGMVASVEREKRFLYYCY
jgi:hypothetical protein